MRPAHADWLAAHVTPSTHSTCPAGRPRAAAATRRKVSGRPETAGRSRRPAQHPPGPQALLRREATLKPTVSNRDNFSQLTKAIICIFYDPRLNWPGRNPARALGRGGRRGVRAAATWPAPQISAPGPPEGAQEERLAAQRRSCARARRDRTSPSVTSPSRPDCVPKHPATCHGSD